MPPNGSRNAENAAEVNAEGAEVDRRESRGSASWSRSSAAKRLRSTIRSSQLGLAASVPLSPFTSRVVRGSAFYVSSMKSTYWLLAIVVAAPQLFAADTGLYDISDRLHPKPFVDRIG